MKIINLLILLLFFMTNSIISFSQYKQVKENNNQGNKSNVTSKTIFYIDPDENDIYDLIELTEDQSPEPIQGRDQFRKDFYRLIKYPPSARENGIEGIVLLEIIVDRNGKIIDTVVKEGISKECDNSAIEAFKNSTKDGFKPFIINNIQTKFKIIYPVFFELD